MVLNEDLDEKDEVTSHIRKGKNHIKIKRNKNEQEKEGFLDKFSQHSKAGLK